MANQATISLLARLRGDSSQFVASMGAASASLQGVERRAVTTGQKLEAFSRSAILPVAAIGAAAVGLAADFESSFAKIEGLVGVAGQDLEDLKQSALSLAGETAKGPGELADAMFFVTSAGLRGTQAMEALEFSAKAAAAGLGDTAEVADAATSAMNAYASSGLSAEQATDILVATVREGKVEASELASQVGKVIPLAADMGVGFEEVGAAIAAMTRLGADAAVSTTALRAIFSGLKKPSSEAEETLAEFGTSAAELRRQLDEEGLLTVLMDLKERFGDNETAMAKVFPNVRALTGVLNLVGENAAATEQIFANMADTTGMTEQAFEAMSNTAGFKAKQALADLQVALVQIGDALLPIVATVADGVAAVAKAFTALPAPVRSAVTALGGALAVFGLLSKGLDKLVMTQWGGAIALRAKTAATAIGRMAAAHPAIAGLTVAVGAATAAWALFRDETLVSEEAVSAFISTMEAGESTLDGLHDLLLDGSDGSHELLSALTAAGSGLREMEAALESGDEAWNSYMRRIVETAEASGASKMEQLDLLATMHSIRESLGEATARFEVQQEAVNAGRREQAEYNAEIGRFQALGRNTRRASGQIVDSFGDMEEATEDALKPLDAFSKALTLLVDPQLALREASRDYAETMAELSETIRENNDTITNSEERHRANADALDQSTRDALAFAEAATREANDVNAGLAVLELHRQSMIDNADQYGMTKAAMSEYLDEIGLVPASVETVANVHTRDAMDNLRDLRALTFEVLNAAGEVRRVTTLSTSLAATGHGSSVAKRAMGGPLAAGQVSVVGERGPELFVPSVGGNVVPNHALGGGVNISVSSLDPQTAADLVAQALDEHTRRNGGSIF